MFYISLTGRRLYINSDFFPEGRKEDETDENWIEKEKERAQKEREREERGKKAQMLKLLALLYNRTAQFFKQCIKKEHGA